MTLLSGYFSEIPQAQTQAWGYRSGAWHNRRHNPVAVVWHTTGAGVVRRHKRNPKRWPSPFHAALWVFTKAIRAGPHMLICGETGLAVQLAPIEISAWHVGRRKGWRYAKMWDRPRYNWWTDKWAQPGGILSPYDLAGGRLWRGGECNPNTYGIEVSPNRKNPTGRWSDETYATIRGVAEIIESELDIPRSREFQLGHSDAHPIARTRRGQGWDPSSRQFSWLDTLPK